MQTVERLPWALGLEEYQKMFDLTESDLSKRILEAPGGVSSFNAQMWMHGHKVVTIGSEYDQPMGGLEDFVTSQLTRLNDQVNEDEAYFKEVYDVEAMKQRMYLCAHQFLHDYNSGISDKRYLSGSMNQLPFDGNQFDIVLCAHWLFAAHGDSHFQNQAIKEFMRVATEVRIFPLMMLLQEQGFGVEVREVSFALKPQGNAMLRIWARQCDV